MKGTLQLSRHHGWSGLDFVGIPTPSFREIQLIFCSYRDFRFTGMYLPHKPTADTVRRVS